MMIDGSVEMRKERRERERRSDHPVISFIPTIPNDSYEKGNDDLSVLLFSLLSRASNKTYQ